jgi:protein-L-isoaspartate(D-aspartate) O-methyltransferase
VRAVVLGAVLLMGCGVGSGDASEDLRGDRADERARMVREQIAARGVRDPRVLAAMEAVPRHELVPESVRDRAYHDAPLPIGEGQTISQPYIVAAMSEAAALRGDERVLEVGTGSGYQAAVLSRLAREVFTIELEPSLAASAAAALARLGCANVATRTGDGYAGWPEAAPFDAILVTAAPDHVPEALVEQLAPGGRMVIPVGSRGGVQQLLLLERTAAGVVRRSLMPVMFVPLRRDADD